MGVILKEPEYGIIIDNLVRRRKELGLTQKQVAEHLEIDQSEVSRIETKETQIDILLLKRLTKILQLPIEAIFK